MSKLLKALLKKQELLKASGWKPKFKGDTGMNIAQLMIDNNVELRNEWDRGFIDTFKQLKEDDWCHYSGMPSPNSYK